MCERNYTYEEKKLINGFKLTNPHICVYCGEELKGNDIITVDHKTPICRGGETIEENLAIACYPCNNEKDDMTVEEYTIYKQKQKELNQKYEVNKLIDDLIDIQTLIMTKNTEINNELQDVEKEIVSLQQDIMYGRFNACEGFLYTKTLNELLLKREELKIAKIGYNHMNVLMGSHRENTIDLKNKIQTEVNKVQRLFIKNIVIGKRKKQSKLKITHISECVEPIMKNLTTISSKSKFTPILVPSTPVQQKEETIILGNAIHKTTNEKLKVISKVDDNHYVVKRVKGEYQVLCSKNILNLELLQPAR